MIKYFKQVLPFSCNKFNKNQLYLKFNNFNFSKRNKNRGISNTLIEQGLSEYNFTLDPSIKNLKTSTGNFPYLPINDHPMIPGYSRFLPLSLNLAQKINKLIESTNDNKDNNEETSNFKTKIVMSVNKESDNNLNNLQLKNITESINYIPEISSSKQVFDVGCICEIQITDQRATGTSALIVPLAICKINEFTIEPKPNELAEVNATIYKDDQLSLYDLDDEQKLKYEYLKQLIEKTIQNSKDDQFIRLILTLKQNYNIDVLNDLIFMSLASLSLPKFFHKYGFLTSEISNNNIQEVLETKDLYERLNIITKLFANFSNKIELWEKLEYEYDHGKEKTKIHEKLQSIYQNLKSMFETDKDDKNAQVEKYKKNMEGKTVPEHIIKVYKEELERFVSTDKHSMDSNVIRNYLDVLTSLPYGIQTQDNLDLINAKNILEQSHYGMQSVKQRILECIAVNKIKNKSTGKILCFTGPPGVGKTSIAESIAKSLNKKFFRIALGGDKDTSSLKGFRRTYVGSMPGKIINALRKCGTENPVILLDEIDKLTGRSVVGDPSSVLLEVLDPEQNSNFTDDYLDVAVDLSKVFFLCTANDLTNVPQPLLDRMEIIEVSGYTTNEKNYIYNNFLKPKAIKLAGLENELTKFNVREDAIHTLISDYCRESGVRSLQKYTNRIYEKIAFNLVSIQEGLDLDSNNNYVSINENFNDNKLINKNKETISSDNSNILTDNKQYTIEVSKHNLRKFIGQARFSSKRLYDSVPKGVSIGLGFNNYGGTILYIEANKSFFLKDKNTEKVIVTGNVGKVMNESCNIAISFAKSFLNNKLNKIFFEENSIHLHFIEGAIEKDGPSAGIAITTALLSLALDKPIVNNLAMTGEVTLLGKVLPIGGVKEKIMAGKREGMNKIILPFKNKEDVEELEDYIKKDIEFYFVENYDEVFRLCFPDVKL